MRSIQLLTITLAALPLSFAMISIGAAQQRYAEVAVIQPESEQTLHDNEGNVLVEVDVQPELSQGDQVVVLLDGHPVARAAAMQFPLSGVERGEHAVEALVVDANGNAVSASPRVTFYVWQASRQNPNSPLAPRPRAR